MIEIRFLGEETRAAGLCLTSRPLQRMALLAKAALFGRRRKDRRADRVGRSRRIGLFW